MNLNYHLNRAPKVYGPQELHVTFIENAATTRFLLRVIVN